MTAPSEFFTAFPLTLGRFIGIKHPRLRSAFFGGPSPQARSSGGERYVDTVEVGSSNLPAPIETEERLGVRNAKDEIKSRCGQAL